MRPVSKGFLFSFISFPFRPVRALAAAGTTEEKRATLPGPGHACFSFLDFFRFSSLFVSFYNGGQ